MLTVYLDSPEEIAEALVKIAGRLKEAAAKIEDEHLDEIVILEDENYELRQQDEMSVEDAKEIARLERKVRELEKANAALDAQVDEAAERIVELEAAAKGAKETLGESFDCFRRRLHDQAQSQVSRAHGILAGVA